MLQYSKKITKQYILLFRSVGNATVNHTRNRDIDSNMTNNRLNQLIYFFNIHSINYIGRSAIKDGYESDSTLIFKRRDDVSAPTPQTPSEIKSVYSQIQRGGDIPATGLRMTVPERPTGK